MNVGFVGLGPPSPHDPRMHHPKKWRQLICCRHRDIGFCREPHEEEEKQTPVGRNHRRLKVLHLSGYAPARGFATGHSWKDRHGRRSTSAGPAGSDAPTASSRSAPAAVWGVAMRRASSSSAITRSAPEPGMGPVPAEAQKHVAAGVVQATAATNSPARRAR